MVDWMSSRLPFDIKLMEERALKGLFRPPVRAELDDQDRQRNMRREKYQGKSRQDRGPPLQATQRGLKYENATRGLFYALSGATR